MRRHPEAASVNQVDENALKVKVLVTADGSDTFALYLRIASPEAIISNLNDETRPQNQHVESPGERERGHHHESHDRPPDIPGDLDLDKDADDV